MKKLVLACAVMSLGIGSSAYAADMPVKAAMQAPMSTAYSWTGLYVGGHAGFGWGHAQSLTTSANGNFPAGFLQDPFDSKEGLLGGVQAGFNWQFAPQWVLGIEGDFSIANIKGVTRQPAPLVPGRIVSTGHEIDNIASVSGRLGYAFNNLLLYGKGGIAWADFTSTSSSIGPGAPLCCTNGSETRDGWLAGGGLEYGFAPNWSAKIEYNYLDFGNTAVTTVNTATGQVNTRNSEAHVHIAKLGVNYRFGWLGGR